MKRKVVNVLLSVSVAASMLAAAPAAALATETETVETAETDAEDTAAAETEAETAAAVPEDITLALTGSELTITNQTERVFTEARLEEAKPVEADGKETEDAEAAEAQEGETKEQEASVSLVITEENGEMHTFEKVEPETWKEPLIYDEYGFLYIRYTDESGKEQEAMETAQERVFEGGLTMYASSNVHVRKEADAESESLKVISLGAECKAVGAVPGWIQVENEDVKGYVFHSYITEDKARVDALVEAQKEAEAAAAAAAAQAAAEAAAQQAAWQEQQSYDYYEEPAYEEPSNEVYEVSRQKYDDCDGSGHGYYEITYSDGSVAYEEY